MHGWDPRQLLDCTVTSGQVAAGLDSDSALVGFLSSRQPLPTTGQQQNGAVANICNSNRIVNLATLYLARYWRPLYSETGLG